MLGSRPILLHLRGQCPPNPAQPCDHHHACPLSASTPVDVVWLSQGAGILPNVLGQAFHRISENRMLEVSWKPSGPTLYSSTHLEQAVIHFLISSRKPPGISSVDVFPLWIGIVVVRFL